MSNECRCPGYGPFSITRYPKRRQKPEHRALIVLRQYEDTIPMRSLQSHIPGFYMAARQVGSRRIEPINFIGRLLTNMFQLADFELALNWIFLHVSSYQERQCAYHPGPSVPNDQNPLEVLMWCVLTLDARGDGLNAHAHLDRAVVVFWVIGHLLRPEHFGCGLHLFNVYYRTAVGLAPLVSSAAQGGQGFYHLFSGVALACANDPYVVRGFFGLLNLQDRQHLLMYCAQLDRAGDVSARAILTLLL